MASKADLEAREQDCASVQDYVDLAGEALQDPADPVYAKHLLDQAEMQCQFPADYLKVAERALEAGEAEYAASVYRQAEEFCMEGKEFAAVAGSLAAHTEHRDRARGLLERAVKEASQPLEILGYAGIAKSAFADEAFAASLLGKVKERLKTLDDFKTLARQILDEQQDGATARLLYEQAAGLGEGPGGAVEYAAGLVELFDDRATAAELLAGVEGDCMFPGQFVALAEGYKRLLDDGDKAAQLLEQGKEFAMSGEENLDLANGYARLLGDQQTALDLYQQALNDFSAKDDLIRLAGDMAANLDEKSLAAQAYEKAESKISDPNDLAALARAVHAQLGDKDLASGIFGRAVDKIDQPNDLLRLAGEIRQTLDDYDQAAAVYRKALDAAAEYPQLQRLLDVLAGGMDDPELAEAALAKALAVAEDSAALLDVARRNAKLTGDAAFGAQALDQAEEAVNSLDEMRKLAQAVDELAADDQARVERVKAQLAKREAGQAKYVAFQAREKKLSRYQEFIALAESVMDELDDPFYAGQLLEKAEEMLAAGSFNLQQYRRLILAIDRLIGDAEWVRRLLDGCADRVAFFVQLRTLGQTASRELRDTQAGGEWARGLYRQWEERLLAEQVPSAQELSKLARAVADDLDDRDWALALLKRSAEVAATPADLAWLGHFAKARDAAELAEHCYREAAARCGNAEQFAQLVRQLRHFGEPTELLRELYAEGETRLSEPLARLRWAEGIVREFGDREWARRVFDDLEPSFAQAQNRPQYEYSRQTWLETERG